MLLPLDPSLDKDLLEFHQQVEVDVVAGSVGDHVEDASDRLLAFFEFIRLFLIKFKI